MNRMNCIDALHFDNDQILDDQIDPVPKFNFLSVENDRKADLAGHFKAALSEFVGETALICAFEQAGPEHGMNVHSRRDDCTRNLIDT